MIDLAPLPALTQVETKVRIPPERSARLRVRCQLAILDDVEHARNRILQCQQCRIRCRVDMQDGWLTGRCAGGAWTIEAAVAKHAAGERRRMQREALERNDALHGRPAGALRIQI